MIPSVGDDFTGLEGSEDKIQFLHDMHECVNFVFMMSRDSMAASNTE
jgi:hypothetical protein